MPEEGISEQSIRDALAFRQARRSLISGSAEIEKTTEIREGLAQYTGTVAAAPTSEDAVADAIQQLSDYERDPTYVRSFAYASGPAYGVLLDVYDAGWTHRFKPEDDLGELLGRQRKSCQAHLPRIRQTHTAVPTSGNRKRSGKLSGKPEWLKCAAGLSTILY